MSAPEAAPISLFWVPNGLKELPEVHFKFFLQRDWQIDNGFFNTPLMVRTQNPGTQVGTQNKYFGAVSQKNLTRSLVPSVAQTKGYKATVKFQTYSLMLITSSK